MDLSPAVTEMMRTAAMQSLRETIDALGAGAKVYFYATTRPSPSAAPGGVSLAAVTFAYPCGVAADGVLAITDTDFAQITASGTAAWARIVDAAGNWVADLSVGTPAMHTADPLTAEVILASTSLYAGAFLALIGAQVVGN